MSEVCKINVRNGISDAKGAECLAEGVQQGSLNSAFVKFGDRIRSLFPQIGSDSEGIFISVAEGVAVERRIVVENKISGNDGVTTSNVILVERGASAKVSFCTYADQVNDAENSIYIIAEEGARLDIEEVVVNGGGKVRLYNHSAIERMASVESVAIALGNGHSKTEYIVDFNGSEGHYKHSGLYFADGSDSNHYKLRANHFVPDCTSDMLVKGIVAGEAKGNFEGMVYVAQDAQNTEAYQQNRNLLLTDTAQVLTSPQLEIYADDVKCSHGATVGQLDDLAIFYMMQRGLNHRQARALQMMGFANDIIARVSDDDKREEIAEIVQRRIEAV